MTTAFVGSETWLSLLDDPAPSVSFPIIRQLTESDIESLLDVFADASNAGRQLAFEILRTLARRSHELPEVPWTEASRSAFVTLLGERTRMDYAAERPERGGAPSRILWANLDPQTCVQFFLTLPIEQLKAPLQIEAVQTLACLARETVAARCRLEAAAAGGGALGGHCQDALEFVGIVSPERLEHWGHLWREKRDPRALDWLYYSWLSFLPVGHPMDQLLAVLGPPDDGEAPDIYYVCAGRRVYVEVYRSTGFAGCHSA